MSLELEYIKNIKDTNFQKICNRNGGRGGLYDSLSNAEKLLKIAPSESIKSSWAACEQLINFIYAACVRKNFNNAEDKKTSFDKLNDEKFKATLNQMFGAFEGNAILDELHKVRKYRNEATHVSGQKKESDVLDSDLNAAAAGIFHSAEDMIKKLLKGLGLVPVGSNDNIQVVYWKRSQSSAQTASTQPTKSVQPVRASKKPTQSSAKPTTVKRTAQAPANAKSTVSKTAVPKRTAQTPAKSTVSKSTTQKRTVQTSAKSSTSARTLQVTPAQKTAGTSKKSMQTGKKSTSSALGGKPKRKNLSSAYSKSKNKTAKRNSSSTLTGKIIGIVCCILLICVVGYFVPKLLNKNSVDSQYEKLNLSYITDNPISYRTVDSKDAFERWAADGGYDLENALCFLPGDEIAYHIYDHVWNMNYIISDFSTTNEIYQSELTMLYSASPKEIKAMYEKIVDALNAKWTLQNSSANHSVWRASETMFLICKYGENKSLDQNELELIEVEYNPDVYAGLQEEDYMSIDYQAITRLTAEQLYDEAYIRNILGASSRYTDVYDNRHRFYQTVYCGASCFDTLENIKTMIEAAAGKTMIFDCNSALLQWEVEMDGYTVGVTLNQVAYLTIYIDIPVSS